MKIYKYFILCTLFISGLVISGCEKETSGKSGPLKYYDIKGLIEKQIQTLEKENISVSKQSELDGEKETKTIDHINWQKELEPFIQADINKPAYVSSYRVERPDSNTIVYTLISTDHLLVKKLIIKTDSASKSPVEIKANLGSQNQLYRSEREIIASFLDGKLKSYSVEGFQKLATLRKRNFKIEVTVL